MNGIYDQEWCTNGTSLGLMDDLPTNMGYPTEIGDIYIYIHVYIYIYMYTHNSMKTNLT